MRRRSSRSVQPWLLRQKAAASILTACMSEPLPSLNLPIVAFSWSPKFFMVAELEQADDRQLLGQLMITYEWSDWRNGAFWWIQSVYVDPAWRRMGVFRRMHETVMATAKTSPNVCGIRLYVEESNGAAQTVYRRVGLTPSSYAVFETDFVLTHKGLKDRPTEA